MIGSDLKNVDPILFDDIRLSSAITTPPYEQGLLKIDMSATADTNCLYLIKTVFCRTIRLRLQ